MDRGRRTSVVVGIGAAVTLVLLLVLSDELRVQYHLYRLRSGPPELLGSMVDSPAGSAARQAVARFAATLPGRQRLLSLVIDGLADHWDRPLGRGGNRPAFKELAHALCGMRLPPSGKEWAIWAEVRLPPPRSWSQSATSLPSPCASGEALAEILDALCRGTEPPEAITLPSYPGLRFSLCRFEMGLERLEAALKAEGSSIEDGLFWQEILHAWPEMLRSRTLQPWAILVDRPGG